MDLIDLEWGVEIKAQSQPRRERLSRQKIINGAKEKRQWDNSQKQRREVIMGVSKH